MARIIGAIGVSHTPTIGFAHDRDKRHEPEWAPIFTAFDGVSDWLGRHKPDVMLVVYNDHLTSFFFDHYSTFVLGVDDRWQVADEGGGARALPPIQGHAALARHIGASLAADEFDMSFFRDRGLDHGCFSPLSMMLPHEGSWPTRLVPLQVGVLQFPLPSAARCYKLGAALRRAIESYPEDLSVVIVGTGGLSHQVHGERAGFNNPEWDQQFLDLIEQDPEALTRMTHAQFAELGGVEGAEVIMWLIMRGALPAAVRRIRRTYYLPSMTGIATLVMEPETPALPVDTSPEQRARIGAQLAGAERLDGSYPYTLERSAKGYRLNHFLHELIRPAARAAYLTDPEAAMTTAGLSAEEADMVRRRDWQAMIRYGVIFFMLEKFAAFIGVTNLHVYAAMRGDSLEAFMKTRNASSMNYSVAAAPKETA